MADVIVVQTLLSTHIASNNKLQKWLKPIPFHGQINGGSRSDPTVNAIVVFQREILGYPKPAGRVDPGGKTLRALEGKPFSWGALNSDTPAEPEADASAELSDILREMDVKKTNYGNYRRWGDPTEFDTFIKLVLCELNGIKVDCNYIVFDARTVFGETSRYYNQVAFISKKYDENVVKRLIKHTVGYSNAHTQGEIIRVYGALCNSVNEIKKWINFNAGLADADTSKMEGAQYEREIIRRILLLHPPSIYYAVGKRMQFVDERTGIFSRKRYNQFPLVPPTSLPALKLGEKEGIF